MRPMWGWGNWNVDLRQGPNSVPPRLCDGAAPDRLAIFNGLEHTSRIPRPRRSGSSHPPATRSSSAVPQYTTDVVGVCRQSRQGIGEEPGLPVETGSLGQVAGKMRRGFGAPTVPASKNVPSLVSG